MTPSYISADLRRKVRQRAGERCEYCLYPQQLAFLTFEIEHIIAEKHGGKATADNLALACPYCNRHKGPDLGSIDPETGRLTLFFNPRTQTWTDHFWFDGAHIVIVPLTPEGRVTVAILQFNHSDRVQERLQLLEFGQHP